MAACGLHPTGLFALQLPNLKMEKTAQGQWQRTFGSLDAGNLTYLKQAPGAAPHCVCGRWQTGNSNLHYYLNDGAPTSLMSSALAVRFFTTHAPLITQLVKNLPASARDPDLISESRSSPGEGIGYPLQYSWASLLAQMVKNLPAMRETWVWSLGWEGPLEEGMATHSSILDWRIPMDRGTWQTRVHGVVKSWTWLSDKEQRSATWEDQFRCGWDQILIIVALGENSRRGTGNRKYRPFGGMLLYSGQKLMWQLESNLMSRDAEVGLSVYLLH